MHRDNHLSTHHFAGFQGTTAIIPAASTKNIVVLLYVTVQLYDYSIDSNLKPGRLCRIGWLCGILKTSAQFVVTECLMLYIASGSSY